MPSILLAVVCLLSLRIWGDERSQIAALLAENAKGAKVVAKQDENIVVFDPATFTQTTLATFPKAKRFQGTSRPWWSPDGSRILFSHGGKCFLMDSDGRKRTQILLSVGKVYEPSWWVDPHTKKEYVVYKDANFKNTLGRGKGNTWIVPLSGGMPRRLIDIPCDGGLSLDGTHLGETYREAGIIDLVNNKVYKPHKGQTCNGTMSPDNTYRMMYLYLPHSTFGVRDKHGNELLKFTNPKGSKEWQTPRFSTHPDFGMAVARYGADYKLVFVNLMTKKMLVLKSVKGDWSVPHLYLRNQVREPPAGLYAGIALRDPVRWSETLIMHEKTPGLLHQSLSELKTADARKLRSAIEEMARKDLDKIAAETDLTRARGLMRGFQAKYHGMPPADDIRKRLASNEWQADYKAAKTVAGIRALEARLRKPSKGHATVANKTFLKANRNLLENLDEETKKVISSFGSHHQNLTARDEAKTVRQRYALKTMPAREEMEPLKVRVKVLKTSAKLTPQQIAPYDKAVFTVKYKVMQVVEGTLEDKTVYVRHWVVFDGKTVEHVEFAFDPESELLLELVPFDSQEDLKEVTVSDDVSDTDSPLYWPEGTIQLLPATY